MADETKTVVIQTVDQLLQPKTRRSFLRLAAIGGTAVFLPSIFAACDDDDDDNNGGGGTYTLDLRTETGYLQYAHALEQLEAAFYTQVVLTPYASIPAAETTILTDIRNHEVIHREGLRTLLGSNAVPNLAVNFSAINFAQRQSVLEAARDFEDLGVAAYNGAGRFLTTDANITLAGKIVSVEARHAAVIRDLLDTSGTAFANDEVVDANGLDGALGTEEVLEAAGAFITTDITVRT